MFTPAGGADPSADGIAVGDFVSVYPDADIVAVFIGRITAVTSTTFTVSGTAISGTSPVDGTTNTSAKIGGAWAGPSGTSGFPLTFMKAACTNAGADPVRINLKNDASYVVSANITYPASGWKHLRGYASAYGDGGRAVLDGGTTGAAYTILTLGTGWAGGTVIDLEVKNNGATGGSTAIHGIGSTGGAGGLFRRCVFRDLRSSGLNCTLEHEVEECEFYGCNQGNIVGCGGIRSPSGIMYVQRSIFHDNTGANTAGIVATGSLVVCDSVFDTNGTVGGVTCQGDISKFYNCDFYNNTGPGIDAAGVSHIENCNFIKNGTWGIDNSAGASIATIFNCGYGSGTQANTSGNVSTTNRADEVGAITYVANVTPWVDPANGDFRVNLAAAKGSGRGLFLQTAASYSGTVGFPDIGAAQHIAQSGADIASGNDKTTSTSIAATTTINANAGDLIIATLTSDNEDTADGETSLHTSVTINAVSMTKAKEFTNAQGAANAGVTVSVWYLLAQSAIVNGVAVAGTLNTGKDAKAIELRVFPWPSGYTVRVDGTGTLANDAADPGSLTATGTLDFEHLWWRGIGSEESNTTVGSITSTSGWTGTTGTGTTGGAAASNISVRSEWKVSTGVSSGASDPTLVSADHASALVGFVAVPPAGISSSLFISVE